MRGLLRTRVSRVAGLLVLAGLVAGCLELADQGGTPTDHSVPSFVKRALGAKDAHAPALRNPAKDTTLQLGDSGAFTIKQLNASLTVQQTASKGGGWSQHQAGAARSTSFGSEQVVTTKQKAEQYLSVGKHVGTHTWSWLLNTNLGTPSVRDSGYVAFVKNHFVSQQLLIPPPKILDAAGKDIT
jgi:hypothetical protein